MSKTETAVAKVTPQTMEIKGERDFQKWVSDRTTEMQPFLTAGRDTSWLQKEALLAVMASDDIKKILKTKDGQISFIHAMRYASAAGLPLNPQLGKASLVPRGGKILYWPMKGGLVDLLMETGKVSYVISFTVKENDEFRLPTNPHDTYTFTPSRRERGKVDGYCAVAELVDGKTFALYWTADEVTQHKARYSPKTAMSADGYGEKTVLKQLCGKLNLGSSKLDAALNGEDDGTYGYTEGYREDDKPRKGVSGDDLLGRLGDVPFAPDGAPDGEQNGQGDGSDDKPEVNQDAKTKKQRKPRMKTEDAEDAKVVDIPEPPEQNPEEDEDDEPEIEIPIDDDDASLF
jgi:phage RecT family recombinase